MGTIFSLFSLPLLPFFKYWVPLLFSFFFLWEPSISSPLPLLQLSGLSQKGAHTLLWRFIFAAAAQGHLHCLALGASVAYARGSHRTVTNGEEFLNSRAQREATVAWELIITAA